MPYRYDPVRPSLYGATIGDMILRQGDISAQEANQVAAVKSRGVQNIGAGIANGLQDVATYKAQAPRREMQQLQLQAMRDSATDRQTERQDHELARHNAITTQIGLELHNSGNTLEAMQAALDKAEKNKLITSEQAQQFGAMVSADPSKIPHVAQAWIGATPAGQALLEKTVTQKPGEIIQRTLDGSTVGTPAEPAAPKTPAELAADAANPKSPTQAQSATALDLMRPPKEPTPKGYQHVDKLLDGKPTTLLIDPSPGGKIYDLSGAPVEKAAARVRPIPAASITIHNDNKNGPNLPAWALDDTRPSGPEANRLDPSVRMTPNGLYQAAQNYIATGQFPPTGRGSDPASVATRTAITSKVGAIAASAGMDEPALRAFYKSNAASLAQQQKMQDSVQGFMATADKNAALLQETLKKIPDIGSPLFNKPLRAFAANVKGDPNMAQFATYLQSVQNEYGRIISQPNLAGQLTDSARHEAETLASNTATVPQLIASLSALRQEGNNRLLSVGEQIQRIQQRMQGGPNSAQSDVIYARDPQGVVHQAQAGTPLPAGWVQVQKQ